MKILFSPFRKIFNQLNFFVEWFMMHFPDPLHGVALRSWYFSKRAAKVGRNFKLHRECDISAYDLIEVGDNCGIARYCTVAIGPGKERLRIGNRTYIGPECYIRNANHRFDDLTKPLLDQGHESKNITIGNDCWIGAKCIILGGANIGDHSVIAAGSVVSTEIPPYSIAVGNPARVVKRRQAEERT